MSEGIVPIEFIDGTEFTLSAYNSIIKNLRPNPSAQNSPESQSVPTCASMDTSRTDTALEISSRSFGDASSSDVTGKNPESANRSSLNPGVRLYTPPERATRYKLHEDAMKPPVSNRNAGRFEHSIPKRKLSFASSELRSHNVTPLNWSPMNTSCISFSKIVSSTPLSQYGDPRNMQPLDLSVSCSEESPLDCSLRNEEIEPMNLVVKIPRETRPLPSTYGALNFVCHDRRTPEKVLLSTSARQSLYGHHKRTEENHGVVWPGAKRRLVLSQADLNISNPIHHQRHYKFGELKDDSDKENSQVDFDQLNPSPSVHHVVSDAAKNVNSNERSTFDEAELVTHEYDDDDEDDEDFVPQGDASLLDDFSIFEYFESFRNQSIIDEDENEDNPANAANNYEKFDEMGFADLDREDDEVPTNVSKKLSNKLRKEKGLSYVRKNGTEVAARKLRKACTCMKRKCYEKFNDALREKLLRNLLELKSSGQNQFLSQHVAVTFVERHRVINSRRAFTYKYYLPRHGGQVRVCLQMFLNTFDVTEKKIRILVSKKVSGLGISADDKRLLNTNRCPISSEEKTYIEEHIKSFPAYFSHYTREKSSKKYLSSDLNITKMYELYTAKCKEDSQRLVHYNSYRIIFNGCNLGFRKPKADTCNECDRLKILLKSSDEDEKNQAEDKRSSHQNQAQLVYTEKKKDVQAARTDPAVRTISFDLQKCLATPHLRNGVAFYKRQLYTYNLTIFETYRGKNKGFCYMWDESQGRRGANEIGSCLLEDLKTFLSENPDVKIINLYSDRCGGQNLNFVVCMMLSYLTEQNFKNNRDVTIRHKFMHSN